MGESKNLTVALFSMYREVREEKKNAEEGASSTKSIRKSKNADEERRWEEEEIKKLDKIEKM